MVTKKTISKPGTCKLCGESIIWSTTAEGLWKPAINKGDAETHFRTCVNAEITIKRKWFMEHTKNTFETAFQLGVMKERGSKGSPPWE